MKPSISVSGQNDTFLMPADMKVVVDGKDVSQSVKSFMVHAAAGEDVVVCTVVFYLHDLDVQNLNGRLVATDQDGRQYLMTPIEEATQ